MTRKVKIIIAVVAVIVGVMIGLGIRAGLAFADDESSVEATVEVNGGAGEVYGDRVMSSRQVLLPRLALKEPDNRSAFMLGKAWEIIKLEETVNDAGLISIWAAANGLGASHLKVYVSKNGSRWTKADKFKVRSASFRRYDISGSFGKVRYIKIERSGSALALIRLDAVAAKGCDSQ